MVVMEELQSKNMLRNQALAIVIANVDWHTLLKMLFYKYRLYDRHFVTFDPHNTNQTCNNCCFIMENKNIKKLTLADGQCACSQCGNQYIRNWNTAQNILKKLSECLIFACPSGNLRTIKLW